MVLESYDLSKYKCVGGCMISKILGVLKLLIIGFVITAIMLSGMALCVYRFGWGEQHISLGIFVVYAVSTLVGGFLLAYKEKRRRLLCGIAYGIMYFIVLLMVSLAAGLGKVDTQGMFISILTCVISGGIGGVLVK